jgi:hypothetical protein
MNLGGNTRLRRGERNRSEEEEREDKYPDEILERRKRRL